MNRTSFIWHQIKSEFFKPLAKKYRFLTVSAAAIIGGALYAGVDIGFAEVVRQNSNPIYTFAAELLIEHGPDYVEASKEHADMLDLYIIKYLEQRQRQPAAFLRVLYPTYSPRKALEAIRQALESSTTEEAAKKTIWQAGLASNRFYMRSKRFPRSPIAWLESEDLPDWLLTGLEQAFDTFRNQVNNLESAKTLEVAKDECRNACKASRRAIILLSLARLGYGDKERIGRFLDDLERARALALDFAERARAAKDTGKEEIFSDRASNMDLRAEVVKAMLAGDMDRADHHLREVIERAFEKHKARNTKPALNG